MFPFFLFSDFDYVYDCGWVVLFVLSLLVLFFVDVMVFALMFHTIMLLPNYITITTIAIITNNNMSMITMGIIIIIISE